MNENGHFFILNRLSNKVYFFFKNKSEQYQMHKFVFTNIVVEGVDSSGDLVVFWSSDDFVVYDISPLKNDPL